MYFIVVKQVDMTQSLNTFGSDHCFNLHMFWKCWNKFHPKLYRQSQSPILSYFASIEFSNENLFIHAFNDKLDNLTLITVTNWKIVNLNHHLHSCNEKLTNNTLHTNNQYRKHITSLRFMSNSYAVWYTYDIRSKYIFECDHDLTPYTHTYVQYKMIIIIVEDCRTEMWIKSGKYENCLQCLALDLCLFIKIWFFATCIVAKGFDLGKYAGNEIISIWIHRFVCNYLRWLLVAASTPNAVSNIGSSLNRSQSIRLYVYCLFGALSLQSVNSFCWFDENIIFLFDLSADSVLSTFLNLKLIIQSVQSMKYLPSIRSFISLKYDFEVLNLCKYLHIIFLYWKPTRIIPFYLLFSNRANQDLRQYVFKKSYLFPKA